MKRPFGMAELTPQLSESNSIPDQKLCVPKALLVGSVLAFFISVGSPYSNMVLHGSSMSLDFSTPGAVFLFFLVTFVVNSILRGLDRLRPEGKTLVLRACVNTLVVGFIIWLCHLVLTHTSPGDYFRSLFGMQLWGADAFTSRRAAVASSLPPLAHAAAGVLILAAAGACGVWHAVTGRPMALTAGESILAYVMMIIASAITDMGLCEYLLPIIPAYKYYATNNPDWQRLIWPHAREWMTLQSDEAIKYFYEGLPIGGKIPWDAWMRPLAWWALLLIAVYVVMMCMMNILRKQWVEHERLIFPLTRLPLAVAEGEASGQLVNPFYKNWLMWLGFAIPASVSTMVGLHSYFEWFPAVQTVWVAKFEGGWPNLIVRVSFPMVGFSYLVNLDIALSLWLFNLFFWVVKGAFSILGVGFKEFLGGYGVGKSPILAHLGMGAMTVFVLYGLWGARRHLWGVVRKAFGGGRDVDDSGEILSYAASFWGMIGGLIVIGIWIWASGLKWWIVPLFLFWTFLIFLALTRVVAEGGVAEAVAPTIGSVMTTSTVGSRLIGPGGFTALAFTWVWSADIRTFVMASYSTAMKLGTELFRKRRIIFWTSLLAVVISMVSSIWIILYLSYTHGGVNMQSWFFGTGCRWPFEYAERQISIPTTWTEHMRWARLCNLIGAVLMFMLMFARHAFVWWPLHPIGFPIGMVWIMDQIWLSIFIAWLVKLLVLKYGGPRLFGKLRPFFLGLILGQFAIAGFWLVIDYFTGKTGNSVFWI